jgi:hypothetical protein
VSDRDFARLSQYKWYAHVRYRKDGSIKNVYALRKSPRYDRKQEVIAMHRFIFGITDPMVEVDHKNHNGLNNQRSNLRKATPSQNSYNRRGNDGVHWVKGKHKWRVSIKVDKKRLNLGHFSTKNEALRVRKKAAKKFHKEFTWR